MRLNVRTVHPNSQNNRNAAGNNPGIIIQKKQSTSHRMRYVRSALLYYFGPDPGIGIPPRIRPVCSCMYLYQQQNNGMTLPPHRQLQRRFATHSLVQ